MIPRSLIKSFCVIAATAIIALLSAWISTRASAFDNPPEASPAGAAAPAESPQPTEPTPKEGTPSEPAPPSAETKPAAKPVEPKPIPMELQPYRVHVSVAFEEDASLPLPVRHEVLEKLAAWIDRTYAQMWQPTIEENFWLSPVSPIGLSRVTPAIAEAQVPDKSVDKLLVLTVTPHGGGWLLAGREWDRMMGQVCAPASRIATDRRLLGQELGMLLLDLFHPLIFIESVEGGRSATVRIRAGEFPPGDPNADQWAAGAFFQPAFLTYDKERHVTKIQFVPWSYIEAQSFDRAVGKGIVHTGLSLPLGKNSKRMESWAIGVRPTYPETRLKITPHNNPTKPLTGYSVNIYEKQMLPPPPPDPKAEAAKAEAAKAAAAKPADGEGDKGTDAATVTEKPPEQPLLVPTLVKVGSYTTDRRGQVIVPRNPATPLIWLYVSSGGSLLGRFPYIPGLTPSSLVELPDDSLRLNIESRLELLRAEFVDVIARRALLQGRCKTLARSGDPAKFNEALAELAQQPDGKHFQTMLDAIKAATLKQAEDAKNKALAKKIEKLCKESAEMIDRHLSVEKLDTIRNEILDLKKIEDETRSAENPNPNSRQAVPGKKPMSTSQ